MICFSLKSSLFLYFSIIQPPTNCDQLRVENFFVILRVKDRVFKNTALNYLYSPPPFATTQNPPSARCLPPSVLRHLYRVMKNEMALSKMKQSKKATSARVSDSESDDYDNFADSNDDISINDSENDGVSDVDYDDGEDEDDMEEEVEDEGQRGREAQKAKARKSELEDLEKEYESIQNQDIDILENLKRLKDEDILKGQAVKNQKALWDKNLEFRFLLQKPFTNSNRLPQEPLRSSFCDSDEVVSLAYSDLINSSKKTLDSLLELQETLLESNPSIAQSSSGSSQLSLSGNSLDSSNINMEDEWLQVSQVHERIASFRDKSVDKWQRKTQVTSGAAAIKRKLQAFDQNISEQVTGYMRDPSRMVEQMQMRRSTIGIFGSVPNARIDAKGEEANPEGDPELLDDSEFYQQLLKEFFETIDPNSNEKAFYALKRLQKKKRKVVDQRASKSRKIRYDVHEKVVNFMAPQPMDLPPMAPKLFENLFGLKT